jgi:prephenate dehydratase
MPIRIGYLGPGKGTFGYVAAQKFFTKEKKLLNRKKIEFVPYLNHTSIVAAVGKMDLDFGVVAVENSTDGIISQTVRSMAETKVHFGVAIYSEVLLSIKLYPLRKGFHSDLPRKIVSHASPLQQARSYVSSMQEHGVIIEQVESTDFAAREAASDDTICAIAAKIVGDLYDLKSMTKESIEDEKGNETRFWVISKSYNPYKTNRDKTTFLCFLDRDTPGGLAETFQSFSEVKPPITVAIAYTIPLPSRNWEYVFLVEVYGYITDENMLEAWQRLRTGGFYLTPPLCLGSYPAETV